MKKRPHILFLLTDQQRHDTIRALGNQRIVTPALDALARESVVFDHCYTPAPVCVPARFSLFSGQYPARTGCCNNNGSNQYHGNGFYASFSQCGYQTCCVGKMHHARDLYGPMGFQERWTQEELSHPEDNYTQFLLKSPYRHVFDYNGMRSEMYYIPQISQLPAQYHPTQWVGNRSVDFLRRCDTEKPIFLMASFIHPHPPFAPPAPWNKIYRTVSEEPYMPSEPEAFSIFMSDRFTREKLGISRQDLTLLRNYYYSCISFVDYQVGRIINELKRRNIYKDTVIVFSSDHGEMLGDFGTMGKRTMLDGSSHIPLMIRIPGTTPQHRQDVCSLVDLAPTLLSCAEIPYDSGEFDGINLWGGMNHSVVYSQYSTGMTGVYMAASARDRLVYFSAEDRYFYFDCSPEDANKYDLQKTRCQEMRGLLDTYRAGDCCDSSESASDDDVSGVNRFPYGPKRADHLMRKSEEQAQMPQGYSIDL